MDQRIKVVKLRKGQIADVLADLVADGDRGRPRPQRSKSRESTQTTSWPAFLRRPMRDVPLYPLCRVTSTFMPIVGSLSSGGVPCVDGQGSLLDLSQEPCHGGSAQTSRVAMQEFLIDPDHPGDPGDRLHEDAPDRGTHRSCGLRRSRSFPSDDANRTYRLPKPARRKGEKTWSRVIASVPRFMI